MNIRDLYNDTSVIEAVNNLQNEFDNINFLKETGLEITERQLEALKEAQEKLKTVKKLSALKRIKAKIGKIKNNKNIIEKYSERALNSNIDNITVKLFDVYDKSYFNKYYKACDKCASQLKSLLNKVQGKELSNEEMSSIKEQMKNIVAERNKVVAEVEAKVYKKVEKVISMNDVKNALRYIKSSASNYEKVSNAYNNIESEYTNIDGKHKTLEDQIKECIVSCTYMVLYTKFAEIDYKIDNAKTIVVTAAQAAPKAKKDKSVKESAFDDLDLDFSE